MANGAVVLVGDPDLARWGTKIALFRERINKTQDELAEELGVTRPTVWKWENGKMEPRRHHKKAIAEALGTIQEAIFS